MEGNAVVPGEALSTEQAVSLLERSSETCRAEVGSLSLQWLQNDQGRGCLIAGPNGEFIFLRGEVVLH